MAATVKEVVLMVVYFLMTSLAQNLLRSTDFTQRLNPTGGQVCAIDSPSTVITMKARTAGGSVLMKCGAQCLASSCRLYQYKSDKALCELYDDWPLNFTTIEKCKAYGVPSPDKSVRTTQSPDSHTRLVGGNSRYEGRVEVFHDGRWGTVCDDSFEAVDAAVVCASLGHSRNGTVAGIGRFGQGADPIWLDDVGCSGHESSIHACVHTAWGSHNCIHAEDVGVICNP